MRHHKTRYIALAAYDAFGAVVCATLLSCAFAPAAYAYVDPSVMTYTIQAIAGVAVALGAVAGVAFRRSRRALMKALNIDENARKEKEPLVHRLDENGQPIITASELQQPAQISAGQPAAKHAKGGSAPKHAKEADLKRRNRLRWPSRLWRSAIASVLLVGTLFLVAPAEMVAANETSLVFGLIDVWNPILMQAAVIAVCLAIVMSLFLGRAFDIVFALVIALGICLYVQALFLNATLPAADGSPFVLSDHMTMAVISTVVWVVVIAGLIVLSVLRRNISNFACAFVGLALIIVQGAAVASLWIDLDGAETTPTETTEMTATANGSAVMTKEGLFELSPKNNVIVLVLDTFDVLDMNSLLASEPDILSEMTGFTYFRDSSGSLVPTRYGIPFLLSGVFPRADQTWDQYLTDRYPSSTLTDDIVDAGYSLYVYTDTLGRGGMEHISPLATNIHPLDETQVHTTATLNLDGVMGMLYQMALYRDLPWVAKEPFWFYTDAVNQSVYHVETYEEDVNVSGRVGGTTPYVMDDAEYYQELVNRRLSIYDDGAKGSVHFIHLLGLHPPYTIDENAEQHGSEMTSRYQQTKGTLLIMNEYLRQLKELGIYDDSYIIITADHGIWAYDVTIEESEADGDMAGGAIMLVKPAQTAEEAAQPCQVSNARTGHLDYAATLISAVGGDSSKYGTTVFETNDPNRTRYYYWTTHDGRIDFGIYEYEITGDVSDWYSWHRTGVWWDYSTSSGETL